jgi:hypothetical protein
MHKQQGSRSSTRAAMLLDIQARPLLTDSTWSNTFSLGGTPPSLLAAASLLSPLLPGGTFSLELLDAAGSLLLPYSDGGGLGGGQENPLQSWRLIQMPSLACPNCTLRLVQTLPGGAPGKLSTPPELWSCADVNITQGLDACFNQCQGAHPEGAHGHQQHGGGARLLLQALLESGPVPSADAGSPVSRMCGHQPVASPCGLLHILAQLFALLCAALNTSLWSGALSHPPFLPCCCRVGSLCLAAGRPGSVSLLASYHSVRGLSLTEKEAELKQTS